MSNEAVPHKEKIRLGDVLKEYGYVTEEQIQNAVAYQKEHPEVRIGDALIQLGYLSEQQKLTALARKFHMSYRSFSDISIDPEAVRLIPQALAEKYTMLGIQVQNESLLVATDDPLNFYGIEDIRQLTGMHLELMLSEKQEIHRRIQFYYSEEQAFQAANDAYATVEEVAELEDGEQEGGDDAPIIRLLNSLIVRAFSTNASDIHIEPAEEETVVRMRVDGMLTRYMSFHRSLHSSLIARIKIMSNLDIAERRLPQDGHFKRRLENGIVNVRVSILPTIYGEKAVIRLLSSNAPIAHPESFGMLQEDYRKVRRMLRVPHGMIYVTGPTGSGKSTTLYMILEELAKQQINISTIEDPVEKNIRGINQVQVNEQSGMSFETGLRSILRQDPDVVMIGETRDFETASISMRAAITGHLVLSTLHTNSAAASVVRLEDMGSAPYMIASSLIGVIAQRLIRRVCPECSVLEAPTQEELEELPRPLERVRHAKGCASCGFTGYRGRIAVHEILMIDKTIRKMIINGTSEEEIAEYAVSHQGMRRLAEAGLVYVENGSTTVEELTKISYEI